MGSPVRLAEGDHVVHFYDAERDLVDLVGSYLTASVLAGDSVVVIAVPEHRNAFSEALAAAGVDAGRVLWLDADEVLSGFMSGGMPSRVKFDSVVGSTIRRAAGEGRPVRAYGEMVARLWADGNRAGAVELERLWNSLGEETPLALFCAYPRSSMLDEAFQSEFGAVCGLHSEVVRGAPVPPRAQSFQRFVASPQAARQARRFVSAVLRSWHLDVLHDDAVIAVAELAANAVSYGDGDFTVGLTRSTNRLRLAVGDKTPVGVEVKPPRRMAEGGRGLAIVASIADDWGYDLVDGGKVVWAEFRERVRAAGG